VSHDDAALTQAIRRQEERLARDPGSLAFAQLADLYRKVGRTREAAALCRDGLARYPHYTTARLILAKALVADGKSLLPVFEGKGRRGHEALFLLRKDDPAGPRFAEAGPSGRTETARVQRRDRLTACSADAQGVAAGSPPTDQCAAPGG